LIDRGPDSKKVIEQCMKWEKKYKHWRFLYGNHEDLMLDALIGNGKIYHSYDLWWQQGGKQTAYSYLPKKIDEYEKAISQPKDYINWKHLDWLRKRPYYYETENYFFVHAGIPPHTSLQQFTEAIDNGREDMKYQAIWIRDGFIDNMRPWSKKIIFGHTCDPLSFEPIVMKNKIGIDTGVCPSANNKLTAIELPAEKFYFQKSLQEYPIFNGF
jgi:serine/threonine protein phosphatase 1